MKFTIEGKAITDALGQIKKVVAAAQFVNLTAEDNKFKMTSANNEGLISIKIGNVQVEDGGTITCPIDALQGAVKGRKMLEFTLEKSELYFTDNKHYEGKFELPPFTDIEVEPPQGDDAVLEVSDETADAFQLALQTALLSGSFESSADVPMYLKMGPKGTHVMCFDEYYVVKVFSPLSVFSNKMTIGMNPSSLLNAASIGGKNKYKLVLTQDKLWAFNKSFIMSQPLLQMDNTEDAFSNINALVEEFQGNIQVRVRVETQKLKDVLENAASFYQTGTAIGFKVGKKGVELSVKSNIGQIKERIVGDTKGGDDAIYSCELKLVQELLEKVTTDNIVLEFVPDRVLVLQQDDDKQQVFMSAGLTTEVQEPAKKSKKGE